MKQESYLTKISACILFAVLLLSLSSCNDDNNEMSSSETNTDLTDIAAIAEVEQVGEVLDDISEIISFDIESSIELKEEFDTKNLNKNGQYKSDFFRSYFSDCVVLTLVAQDNNMNIKLDFGDGCAGPHGNILKGIVITDIQLISRNQMSINHSFENFSVNDRGVEGSISKMRTRRNDDDLPQAVITRDIVVTWDTGVLYRNEGTFTRTWTEGFENREWADNVFLVEGSWKVSKNSEALRTMMITEPLRREMTCRFLVSGQIQIESINGDYSLNFGDGVCDNIAIVSDGANEYEIELGGIRRFKN